MTDVDMQRDHLNVEINLEPFHGIPDELYVVFGTEFVKITSDPEKAKRWDYATRVCEVGGYL